MNYTPVKILIGKRAGEVGYIRGHLNEQNPNVRRVHVRFKGERGSRWFLIKNLVELSPEGLVLLKEPVT